MMIFISSWFLLSNFNNKQDTIIYFVYQGVTFHTFQNQAFFHICTPNSAEKWIGVQNKNLACKKVTQFARVQKNLLLCTPSHFSALFSAHVPTH